jgi:aspartyl-tRNA(Asn)/glutamyl-tRNA(Gln) amidotransferase subunit A
MTTILQASEQIGAGQLCPTRLVAECLERISQLDDRLHAWEFVDGVGAMRAAEQLARELPEQGPRSRLHGIPIGVKDIVDVAGLPTRAGSPLRQDHVATEDAAVVKALRKAGAVILGKTVTTQFACFDPPATRNPYDMSRTPGGSSSGSAVAVASQMCLGAIGTQTGGSIVRPAAYCGVVGFKPTFGRWDMSGIVPVSRQLDHVGPMTRCVEDLWAFFTACEASEARSSSSSDSGDEQKLPRFAVLGGHFRNAADHRMLEVIDAAVNHWVTKGVEVQFLELPVCFDEVLMMHRRIMAFDVAQYHRAQFADARQQYAPKITQLIEEGLRIPTRDYDAALRHRAELISVIVEQFSRGPSIWMMPATPGPAPDHATTGDPSFNSPWSYLGCPALCIPSGAVDRLPVSLQLVAAPDCDEQLLRAGIAVSMRPPR